MCPEVVRVPRTRLFTPLTAELAQALAGYPALLRQALALRPGMGGVGQPGYDFENADTVLVLGADIFETWGTSTRNRKAFGAARPVGQKPKNKYIYVGPTRNNTAAVCDQWVPAGAGDLGIVALGIAWHLLNKGVVQTGTPGFDTFKAVVNGGFDPEAVRRATGIAPETLAEIAKNLAMSLSYRYLPIFPQEVSLNRK